MTEQPKYHVEFSGQFTDTQVAVGEGNTLRQRITPAARERLTPEELVALAGQLAALRDAVATRAPAGQHDEALRLIDELEQAAISVDTPEPGRLARVYQWFLDNAPSLAESISTLLLGPLIGKLVGGGTGAMAAALGAGATDGRPEAR
jgi:hypothetical protein